MYPNRNNFSPGKDQCTIPCSDTDYEVIPSSTVNQNEPYSSYMTFQYQRRTYNTIIEQELYSWEQLLGEAGGFIGLMMGMSVLSLVEIIVFIAIVAMTHVFK